MIADLELPLVNPIEVAEIFVGPISHGSVRLPRQSVESCRLGDELEVEMLKTIHGKVHGKMIELDEDLGIAEDQEVEVQVKVIEPKRTTPTAMSEGLSKVYAILGERFESGHSETAARHNEHQP